jgi:hypothetical protein
MARTTDLAVAITLSTKTAVFTGQIAIREKINLSITGYGTAGATDLCVGLVFDGVLIAKTQGLTTGTAFTGILDTNTEEAVAALGDAAANTKIKCSFVIWDTTNSCLLVNDWIYVLQNPYNTGMADPSVVEPIGHGEYAPIENGVTNGDAHSHNNGDGAQIDHTDLSNIGTLTHAQIDTLLAFLQGSAALGNLRYSTSTGKWYLVDVDDGSLWHSIEAAGGSTAGFLVLGNGVTFP